MHPMTLSATHHSLLAKRLREECDDEETLADTLEGLTDLKEQIIRVAQSIDEDETQVTGLADRIGQMQQRMVRIQARIKSKRDLIASAMDTADIKKITAPEFTLSLARRPGGVEITDETVLPSCLRRTKVTISPDRPKIKQALEAGQPVPGARMGNGTVSLTIRKT